MIKIPQASGSRGLSVLAGLATGGLAGAGIGVAASGNPAMSRLITAYQAGKGIAGKSGYTTGKADLGAGETDLAPSPYNPTQAIESRVASLSNPVEDGLAALDHPDVPDYVRQAYAEPLLKAKFGRYG